MEEQTKNNHGNQSESSDPQTTQTAVLLVPLPAQGHLNQLIHLSTIITSYGLPVHFAGPVAHNRQVKRRFQGRESQNLSKIQFHDLELPPYDSPPPNPDPQMPVPLHVFSLINSTLELRQPIYELVQQLSTECRRVIVIHDMFMAYVAQDAKLIPNVELYALFAFSAFSMFIDYWNKLPEKPFEIDPDVIPSSIPPTPEFVIRDMGDWGNKHISLWGTESGRLYDTSRVIEGKYVELLERLTSETHPKLRHFAIGPFNPVEVKSSNDEKRHRCIEWLDKQGKSSVIYVSFGTTTSLTNEQIRELAIGLKKSEQKFLWVLRLADRGDIFVEDGEIIPQLPEGYEESIKDRGIIVRDYAPQLEILAHRSTGAFMSHCGWNSCMESITMGVPIAAWPMHTDQPKNAVLVTDVLKIGVMVSDSERHSELVTADVVENAVRKLMASDEGEEIRKRAVEVGEAVRGSVDEGGSHSLEMDAFIAHITR